MENNRPLKELYEILLKHFVANHSAWDGVCTKITYLHDMDFISTSECDLLHADFKYRAPRWYNSKFWWSKEFIASDPYTYWWTRTEAGWNCRVEFIKHIINKLK